MEVMNTSAMSWDDSRSTWSGPQVALCFWVCICDRRHYFSHLQADSGIASVKGDFE